MRELSELLDLHKGLDEMFLAHQSALLHFDFEKALQTLEDYEAALLTHMRDEEEILMPIYSERRNTVTGGDPKLFLDEHAKMRRFVELFKMRLAELVHEKRPESAVIILLDREAFYKRLCGHHDIRERTILYPELDRITSAEEKAEYLGMVLCELETAAKAEV